MATRAPLLQNNTSTVEDAVANAFTGMQKLKDELHSWYNNLPEVFRKGTRAAQLSDAANAIEGQKRPQVTDRLKELLQGVDVHYQVKTRRRQTRSDRRDDCVNMLRSAHRAIDDKVEGLRMDDGVGDQEKAAKGQPTSEDEINELETLSGDIQTAIDVFEGIEFPGFKA